MAGRADHFCHSFVAPKHNRPSPRVSRGYVSQVLSYRTWAIISSLLSCKSDRRAKFALTEEPDIAPNAM